MTFLSCGNVYGQANNKKTVAVITAEGESVSKDIRIGVTNGLQEGVFNSGEYTLLARGTAFEKALSEMKFEQSGAVSDDQLTAFGHAAGAEFVCYATISKYSEISYLISYKMINVASGEIVKVGSEPVRNGVDGLLTATENIAKKLFSSRPAPIPNNSTAPVNSSERGVVINGVRWATCNVAAPGVFAAKPEDAGMFYQWNRRIGWSDVGLVNSNGGSTWNSSTPTGSTWEKANDPSPAGWRVPTLDEIKTLLATDKVSNEWTTQNGVSGEKFTDKATGNSIFLPAAGGRFTSVGTLGSVGTYGYYWSSALSDSGYPYRLYFYSDTAGWKYCNRILGFTVRSVAE